MRLDGLDNKVAFVTGGARGIGRCIAETLHDQGARVASGDLAAPEIDGVLGIALDVTDEASVGAAFDEVERQLGPVDVVVLNAGVFVIEPFERTTLESWRRTM